LALPAAPAVAAQAAGGSLEELAVQLATTPEQHAIVANYYRRMATDARAEAERHRTMERAYGQGKLRDKLKMQEHCGKLIASYEALASEYDELAKGEDAAAKE